MNCMLHSNTRMSARKLGQVSRLLLPLYELDGNIPNSKRKSEFHLKHPCCPFVFAFSWFQQRLNSPITQKHSEEGNSFYNSKFTTNASPRT